jgi:hypothetical protein
MSAKQRGWSRANCKRPRASQDLSIFRNLPAVAILPCLSSSSHIAKPHQPGFSADGELCLIADRTSISSSRAISPVRNDRDQLDSPQPADTSARYSGCTGTTSRRCRLATVASRVEPSILARQL